MSTGGPISIMYDPIPEVYFYFIIIYIVKVIPKLWCIVLIGILFFGFTGVSTVLTVANNFEGEGQIRVIQALLSYRMSLRQQKVKPTYLGKSNQSN